VSAELVPALVVPLPDPVVVKYAHAPTLPTAAITVPATIATRTFVILIFI
jgi:hypothetical protein